MFFSRFKKIGLLGLNARIGKYMSPLNPRKFYPSVDDKVKTALLSQQNQIPTPENYMIFKSYGQLRHFNEIVNQYSSFVIKPARGAMGNGVVVIADKKEDYFIKSSGKILTTEDIRYHILQIMGGLYSLSHYPDHVILQYKVDLHPIFEKFTTEGIPDIRIIVYHGFPIMAMTRLPTKESDGRANLHQGAVGAGVSILNGKITGGCSGNYWIDYHPDTKEPLENLAIPYWKDILIIASRCYEISNLGYLGVDIVIDKTKGPMLLEMNARPGLSIQLANKEGLETILRKFKPYIKNNLTPVERVEKSISILS